MSTPAGSRKAKEDVIELMADGPPVLSLEAAVVLARLVRAAIAAKDDDASTHGDPPAP